jgi:hypothetical protein
VEASPIFHSFTTGNSETPLNFVAVAVRYRYNGDGNCILQLDPLVKHHPLVAVASERRPHDRPLP